MSATSEIRDQLRDKTLFKEFTDQEMDEFIELLDRRETASGELIVRQDELGECMFIVVKGRARVVHHTEGHHVELATLRDGDFFGELSLVDRGPRSADARSRRATAGACVPIRAATCPWVSPASWRALSKASSRADSSRSMRSTSRRTPGRRMSFLTI